MIPHRSRSTTFQSDTSRSDSIRELYSSNPTTLLSPAPPYTSFDENDSVPLTSSCGSQHSLATIRPRSSSPSSRDGRTTPRNQTVGTATTPSSYSTHSPPRSHFIIDITPSSASNDKRTRPRSETFGGVPIPSGSTPISMLPLSSSSRNTTTSTPHSPTYHRSTSSSSLPLHVGGTFAERKPVLYAGLRAGALFIVCLGVILLVLSIMLPTIGEEDKELVKIPKSFEELKALNGILQVYKEEYYWRVLGSFIIIYLFIQAFCIPGSMYMSILAGSMYGVVVALPLICACVATGALLCYFMSLALGPALLTNSDKWQRRVDTWKERISSHNDNLLSYLIVLRISPLPPHWMVNLVAPHLGISIPTFWISTFFGISGVSYIHTTIGTTLDQMSSSSDFHILSWQNGLGLGGIILAVLIPVYLRSKYKKDVDEAAAGNDDPENDSDPLTTESDYYHDSDTDYNNRQQRISRPRETSNSSEDAGLKEASAAV